MYRKRKQVYIMVDILHHVLHSLGLCPESPSLSFLIADAINVGRISEHFRTASFLWNGIKSKFIILRYKIDEKVTKLM